MKVLGPRYGLMVMAADIGKGAAAGAVGRALAGRTGSHLACTAAVVGHCFPIWSGGKGGKGVATGVGQCLATFPAYFPINGGIALATFAVPRWRQRSYAATTVSCVCWVLGALVWWRRGHHNAWGPTPTVALPVAAAASSAVILYKFASASPPEVRGAERVEGAEGVDA
jgi:glycerol-3-phosphate acyltransferase PlsY